MSFRSNSASGHRQTRRDFLMTLGAGASAVAAFTCGRPGNGRNPEERPNVLWITCEDTSPALGCYGDPNAVTPNLDRLAGRGVVFRNAFAAEPICAPARSCIITGMYATSLGTQHLRSEISRPSSIKCLPELMRERGYYCTNNSKTDYNFSPEGLWNENSDEAHWRNRPAGAPFFSVFNITVTHEGNANGEADGMAAGPLPAHDPAKAVLPPYFPDTAEMRRIWAKYYDLVSAMDDRAGKLLEQLKEDGLEDNTIVFFFSDHGFGLPRYKRWPYDSGLRVPFIVAAPPRFADLVPGNAGTSSDRLIHFVDLAPSVTSLAGIPGPRKGQGRAFLGVRKESPRKVAFGARSRADDVYDVCRTVRDRQYRYIRNYMPHLPYIQDALIFDESKDSFRELRRALREGILPESGKAMFLPKPVEELYDIRKDPVELRNLAGSPDHAAVLKKMRACLREHILSVRDTGFLHESEVMIRSEGSTPFEMAQDPGQYDLERILATAERVGDPAYSAGDAAGDLADRDSGVRFWAAQALIAMGAAGLPARTALAKALADGSPCVRLAAAEALCRLDSCDEALPVLAAGLRHAKAWVSLQAAISVRLIGARAKPILPAIRETLGACMGDADGRYKSWSYPMFIGFALDQAMLNCGEDPAAVKPH